MIDLLFPFHLLGYVDLRVEKGLKFEGIKVSRDIFFFDK